MRQGFTLVEIMIVVAIIGILAAIAAPVFLDFIRQSKTSEAKINLRAIQTGALLFFQKEHVLEDGMSIRSRFFPDADPVTGIGRPADNTTMAQKFSASEFGDVLNSKPWTDLNFSVNSPIYFYYNYDANNQGNPSFQASASASLSEPCDAIFVIEGRASGPNSAIIDLSQDSSKCNLAVAPTAATP